MDVPPPNKPWLRVKSLRHELKHTSVTEAGCHRWRDDRRCRRGSLGLLVDLHGLTDGSVVQTTTFALPIWEGPGALLDTES
jgi:hypothetical protein